MCILYVCVLLLSVFSTLVCLLYSCVPLYLLCVIHFTLFSTLMLLLYSHVLYLLCLCSTQNKSGDSVQGVMNKYPWKSSTCVHKSSIHEK
jgi:uncharacterized protein YqgC (DUF456 family)